MWDSVIPAKIVAYTYLAVRYAVHLRNRSVDDAIERLCAPHELRRLPFDDDGINDDGMRGMVSTSKSSSFHERFVALGYRVSYRTRFTGFCESRWCGRTERVVCFSRVDCEEEEGDVVSDDEEGDFEIVSLIHCSKSVEGWVF